MEITIDKKDNNFGVITAQVTTEDYMPEYNKTLKEYAKKAQIKGFRPGKVPTGLIKKMYGDDLISTIFNQSIEKNLNAFIQDSDHVFLLNPLPDFETIVNPEELIAKGDVTLRFHTVLAPADLSVDYESLQFTHYKVLAEESEIENSLDEFKQNMAKVEPVGEVDEDTFFNAEITIADTDFSKTATVPTKQLSESAFQALKGKKEGDSVSIPSDTLLEKPEDLRLLFEMSDEEKALIEGKSFEIMLTGIDKKVIPEITEELLKETFPDGDVTNVDELRQKIKESIENMYEDVAKSLVHSDILKELPNHLQNVVLPKEEIWKFYYSRKEEVSEAPYEEMSAQDRKSFGNFLEYLEMQAYIKKVMKEEKVQLTQEDIMAAAQSVVKSKLSGMGMNNLDNSMIASLTVSFMQREGEDGEEFKIEAENQATTNYIIRYVEQKATIIEEQVSSKTFEEIVSKINAEVNALAEQQEQAQSDNIEPEDTIEIEASEIDENAEEGKNTSKE